MGGINPYLPVTPLTQAKKSFTVSFQTRAENILLGAEGTSVGNQNSADKPLKGAADVKTITLSISPADLSHPPLAGLPGSLLALALAHGIDIDHACGGVCACSTCHVKVLSGLASCNASTEEEEDQLEKAPALSAQSRLACQCVPSGEASLVVEIPAWNRNLVRE